MYSGYELTNESRKVLADIFPPKYPEFLGHHITKKFGTNDPKDTPERPNAINVIGYVDDGKGIEGLLVEIDGKIRRDDNSLYHITWSLDRSKGYKPMDTNKIIHKAKKLDNPISITARPKLFRKSTSQELKNKNRKLKEFVQDQELTNL
jgi:hypothetical protein